MHKIQVSSILVYFPAYISFTNNSCLLAFTCLSLQIVNNEVEEDNDDYNDDDDEEEEEEDGDGNDNNNNNIMAPPKLKSTPKPKSPAKAPRKQVDADDTLVSSVKKKLKIEAK